MTDLRRHTPVADHARIGDDDCQVHDPALPDDTVMVEVWRPDAIVLFDWLQQMDEARLPVRHPAEVQALRDLLMRLEVTIAWPSAGDIDQAREAVAKDMGPS